VINISIEENLDSVVVLHKAYTAQMVVIIAIVGPMDIVEETEKVYGIENGNTVMNSITSTDCQP